MKKVIVIAALFVGVFSGNVYAQGGVHVAAGDVNGDGYRGGARVAVGDVNGDGQSDRISVNHTKTDGTTTVQIPNGRGTLKFVARGDKFSDVIYTDAAGKSNRLTPIPGGTAGAPKTECKYPIPDACFGTADKKIGLCMCRPTNLSAAPGGDPTAVLIGLLLPAVQKISVAPRP